MAKRLTAAQRARKAKNARDWRARNPDYYKLRRKALTPEQRARKVAATKAWRKRNKVKVREWNEKYLTRRKQLARARYRSRPDVRQDHQRRCAEWRKMHPSYSREWYHRKRSEFTGDGRWSKRTRSMKERWVTWSRTLAASRAVRREA